MEKKASFQFKNFIVRKSSIELIDVPNPSESSELHINFIPSGILDLVKSTFTLELELEIKDDDGEVSIHLTSIGSFKFENMDEDSFENYLFHNAPAIMFPYIRAYISTLTALSGVEPILLPTMNLSRLKSKLIDKIVRVTE